MNEYLGARGTKLEACAHAGTHAGRPRPLHVSILILLLGACDSSSPGDAGPDAALPYGIVAPTPPTAANFVCPPGWESRASHGLSICEPWAGEDRAPTCGPGELALVGQPAGEACQPVWPCPLGEWPDDAPADAIYARAGAVGGDGSPALPFGSLPAALAAAQRAHLPLIIDGVFTTGVAVSGIPALIGLCPERSGIREPTRMRAALEVLPGTLEVRGMSLYGPVVGLEVTSDAQVTLRGVSVEGGGNGVWLAARSALEGERVLARGPSVLDTSLHQAVFRLRDQSSVTLRRSTIVGAGGGFIVPNPSDLGTVTLEDSSILDSGYGLFFVQQVLRRVAIERTGVVGLVTAAHNAEWTDVRLRDIGETLWEGQGGGLLVANGSANLSRVAANRIQGNSLSVLASAGQTSTIVAADLFIAETDESPGTTLDDHIAVLLNGAGAAGTFDRIHMAEISGNAFHAESASLTVHDLRILGTRAVETFGRGLEIRGGSALVERAEIQAEELAVFVLNDADATIRDLEVTGSLGIQVQCGTTTDAPCTRDQTHLTLSNVRMRDVRRAGLVVTDAVADVESLDILGVTPAVPDVLSDEFPGMGMLAVAEGVIRGRRIRVSEVGGVGLFGYLAGTFELSELSVDHIHSVPCSDCESMSYGDACFFSDGATVRLTDFVFADVARAGIVAANGFGAPHFERGLVARSPFGLLTEGETDPTQFSGLTFEEVPTESATTNLTVDISLGGLEFL
jgi:hypothetical protein